MGVYIERLVPAAFDGVPRGWLRQDEDLGLGPQPAKEASYITQRRDHANIDFARDIVVGGPWAATDILGDGALLFTHVFVYLYV